ncbi:MAG: SIR2 family protein [Cypionkella sp.]|nr:SIR2 family protein [Cypionkella sp.]
MGKQKFLAGHLSIAQNTPDQLDWGQIYDTLFAEVHTSPPEVSRLFKDTIKAADAKINWAHLALGELARENWISTTITTNFDLLALEGYARAGVIPVVSDGIESLDRMDPNPVHPQLLQINGSIHSYRLRNGTVDLDRVSASSEAITCFRNLFQASDLMVIVGYEGREPQIMTLLTDAARTYQDKHIFWCLYSKKPAGLSDNAKEFLSHSRNARLILGQDADVFFHSLCHELGVGAPVALRDPLEFLQSRLGGIYTADQPEHAAIRAELAAVRDRITHLKNGAALLPAKPMKVRHKPGGAKGKPKTIAQQILADLADLHGKGTEAQFTALMEVQDEFFKHGFDQGNTQDLEISLVLAEAGFPLAQTADQKGLSLNRKGRSLDVLGDRRGDTARLGAAIDAYSEALKYRSRDHVPLDWAITQNNLGSSMYTLGNIEGDRARLQAALDIFSEVLDEHTRNRGPLDWADTKNSIGNALYALGVLNDDTELLQAAIDAYLEAQKEYTRDRAPLQWAMTQNNIGGVLDTLGRRDGDAAKLKAAIEVFSEALKEYTRDRVPMDWAMSFGNQGTTMCNLADLTLDLALTRTALSQLTAAEAQTRVGGHISHADHYASQIIRAKALIERLSDRPEKA